MFEVTIANAANRLIPTEDKDGVLIAGTRQSLTVAKDMLDGITLDPNCDEVLWTLVGGDAYVTYDGTTPSSVNGHPVSQGASISWSKELCSKAKWIGASASSELQLNQMTYRDDS